MIATLLTKLLQKDVKFEWSEKCHQSFEQLKALLMKAPMLVQPKSGKEFIVYSDASLNGLGCVLITQIDLWDDDSVLAELKVRPMFIRQICDAQKNRICVPKNSELIQLILNEAYHSRLTVHPGSSKMYNDLKQFYWWHGMKRDISDFVSKCLIFQQVKAEHHVSSGLLQLIMTPEWKWERITMDFVSGLPLSPGKEDAIWLIVDRLMKSAHFVPVRTDYSLDRLAELYIAKIVRLHGVPLSIVSDRDLRFTSWFWKKLQDALGTKLHFSTAFHPQTDGQSEQIIQVLEDMLRCCILEFKNTWEKHLPLIEFAYNNSFQSSIKMAPYEALYGRKCRTLLYWTELSENKIHGVDLIKETEQKVKVICDSLKAALDRQKSYADLKRKDNKFEVGDKVFLKVSPWKKILRFGLKASSVRGSSGRMRSLSE
ncbi:DNA/RNA polymerases superfamily protein [Gossypium australe]|uniref:DNA/RNA polymerases superfamily protein n=1 Tax=Gossypium australe TaxID=47621 RepID=A0A5B6WV32_9ROSI|nr:DNA/RNA polymerases superfamily protein [Gossypium australe]